MHYYVNNHVFVGNLPSNATEEEIADHMRQAGAIISVEIIISQENVPMHAIVQYQKSSFALWAMDNLDGTELCRRNIIVSKNKDDALSATESSS